MSTMKIDEVLFENAVVALDKVVTNEVQQIFDQLAAQVTAQADENTILAQVIDESIKYQNAYNESSAVAYKGALDLLKDFGDVAAVLSKRNVTTEQGAVHGINVEKMAERARLN